LAFIVDTASSTFKKNLTSPPKCVPKSTWMSSTRQRGRKTFPPSKLMELDEEECARVFRICTNEGFFYLDMLDHPQGRQMYENACLACQVGRDVFPNKTVEEKRTYLKRPELGVFDRG
jgi:hypothetical protein